MLLEILLAETEVLLFFFFPCSLNSFVTELILYVKFGAIIIFSIDMEEVGTRIERVIEREGHVSVFFRILSHFLGDDVRFLVEAIAIHDSNLHLLQLLISIWLWREEDSQFNLGTFTRIHLHHQVLVLDRQCLATQFNLSDMENTEVNDIDEVSVPVREIQLRIACEHLFAKIISVDDRNIVTKELCSLWLYRASLYWKCADTVGDSLGVVREHDSTIIVLRKVLWDVLFLRHDRAVRQHSEHIHSITNSFIRASV